MIGLSVCIYHMTGLSVCMYHMTGICVHSFLCMYRLIHVDDHHSGHTDNKVDFSRADKVSLVVKYVVL